MPSHTCYQIKISLIDSEPLIWRRIIIDPKILLSEFHKILQTIMGWKNSHLHCFRKGREFYAEPDPYDEMGSIDYRDTVIADLLKKEKDFIVYEYDFGDGWEHCIELERIQVEEKRLYPVCINGMNACPPEDCGGIPGYQNLFSILLDPKHEEYNEMVEWIGEPFNPLEFNLKKVNILLSMTNFGLPSYTDYN